MLPGPTYVYECLFCGGHYERRSISSGNTSRAKFRSDGQMSAPMLPTTPLLVACPHCKTSVFWPNVKEMDSYDRYVPGFFSNSKPDPDTIAYKTRQEELAQRYKDVPDYAEVTPDQLLKFIQNQVYLAEHELLLRMQFWGLINDERLASNRQELKPQERENLQRIQMLIGFGSHTLFLLHAEILRELSSFEDAKKILDFDFFDDMAARAEQLMLAIEQKNSMPFEFAAREDQYEYEYAWIARRYAPEDPSKYNFADLKPPVFKIGNRDWWVKVLGMLSHNWALIERNPDGCATVYFFQDQGSKERPSIIDSLEFPTVLKAKQGLIRNGFALLQGYPGPWMGCEPKGFICDSRGERNKIYSTGKFWSLENE